MIVKVACVYCRQRASPMLQSSTHRCCLTCKTERKAFANTCQQMEHGYEYRYLMLLPQ